MMQLEKSASAIVMPLLLNEFLSFFLSDPVVIFAALTCFAARVASDDNLRDRRLWSECVGFAKGLISKQLPSAPRRRIWA
jgi:hypothetical protein